MMVQGKAVIYWDDVGGSCLLSLTKVSVNSTCEATTEGVDFLPIRFLHPPYLYQVILAMVPLLCCCRQKCFRIHLLETPGLGDSALVLRSTVRTMLDLMGQWPDGPVASSSYVRCRVGGEELHPLLCPQLVSPFSQTIRT